MAAATVLNLLVAAGTGIAVPITMERLGRDPALGSSVVLTFVTDSMGFLIFLGLATMLLIH
jgi:magnesium transporter